MQIRIINLFVYTSNVSKDDLNAKFDFIFYYESVDFTVREHGSMLKLIKLHQHNYYFTKLWYWQYAINPFEIRNYFLNYYHTMVLLGCTANSLFYNVHYNASLKFLWKQRHVFSIKSISVIDIDEYIIFETLKQTHIKLSVSWGVIGILLDLFIDSKKGSQ